MLIDGNESTTDGIFFNFALAFLLTTKERDFSMLRKITYLIPNNFNINIDELNNSFDRICIFDSNQQANNNKHLNTSKLIAIGCINELIVKKEGNALEQLQEFININSNWIFGYLSYDIKNELENLISENDDTLSFAVLHFFVPKTTLEINENTVIIHFDDLYTSEKEANSIYAKAMSNELNRKQQQIKCDLKPKISKQHYIDTVTQLKKHIRLGDIYEVNFCQEFYSKNTIINTVSVYENLNEISQAPYSAYCKFDNHYLICSSPERYLQKKANTLISQPIKGTSKRSEDQTIDDDLKNELKNSNKERNENIMIVDLVRNDLSKIAKRGTVKVDELFGVYTYKQVHQLISTVSCELKNNTSFTDIIKNTFPMGSMTGAPKVSAMKLIEQYESTKRGVYSGALGYIRPNGDFDFNVVIRSILYNSTNNYLSFMVGSAITDKADAEKEYEECLLKANALFEVLKINS
jgi:para-aminobenzoate synthetase component 1